MHIRLDPIGGIAGDMFVGAMLDAFPDLEAGVLSGVARVLGEAGACRLERGPVGGFRGGRFIVEAAEGQPARHLGDIRRLIDEAGLEPGACEVAIGIFTALAEAEAHVHGTTVDRIHFHEVGAIDSIADIVAAGLIVAALGDVSWTVGPLPLGGGTVRTRHGVMPVPAPATARLLEGFATHDDGIAGERVTPTGAAILHHLVPQRRRALPAPATVRASGMGFGTKTLPDRPNALRVLVFDDAAADGASLLRDEVGSLSFDIDDQKGEDLALALDRLRDEPGVIDIVQWPAIGKRGRMVACVRILCDPSSGERLAMRVFDETSTIGLRIGLEERRILRRESREVEGTEVKIVARPSGRDAKAEIADVEGLGRLERERRRTDSERAAIDDE